MAICVLIGSPLMTSLLHELRQAARRLRKDWRVALPVIAIFALAIGATTAVFTLVDAVLYRDLPFADPDRLVRVWSTNPGRDITRFSTSNEDFLDWRDSLGAIDLAAFTGRSANLTGDGNPVRVIAGLADAGFAPLLGIEPAFGRWFTASEDQPGSPQVAVLSHELARARFGSPEAALGGSVEIEGRPVEVVGVLAQGFRFLDSPADLWRPLQLRFNPDTRDNRDIEVIGKLSAATTLGEARTELESVAAEIARRFPDKNRGWSARYETFREWVVPPSVRVGLSVLLGAVILVLLIACFNVAGLLLARAGRRNKEFVVQAALGAGRRRLISQSLADALVLATAGGLLGALLADWTVSWVRIQAADVLPLSNFARLDWRALLFAAGAVTIATLLTGLAPAFRIVPQRLAEALKEGGRCGSAGRQTNRFRTTLAAGQLALSIALLIGAGLMLQSLDKLRNAPLGFDPNNVIAASIAPPRSAYPSQQSWTALLRATLERLRNTPGVESAGFLTGLPLSPGNTGIDISSNLPSTLNDGETLQTVWRVASPGYFQTMGIRLIEGQDFTETDDGAIARQIILTRAAAETLWPNQSAVGKQVVIGLSGTPIDVIGVVDDIRNRELETVSGPGIYINYRYWAWGVGSFVVKTAGAPAALVPAIREAVAESDPDLPLYDVKTMSAIVADAASVARLNSALLTGFAGAAALLAAIGIYGVLSFLVEQRRSEFGVRLAVGAKSADILRLVFASAARLFAAAAIAGLGLAWTLSRFIAGVLYETEPLSIAVYAAVVMLAAIVTIAATWLPARRAAQVNPVVALRHE